MGLIQKAVKLSVLCGLLMADGTAYAAIKRTTPITQKRLALSCSTFDFSRGFDIASIKPVTSKSEFAQDVISKIIPQSIKPSRDGSQVAAQIVDHSLSNLFQSEVIRNSGFGRTALDVERKMTADVAFGGTEPEAVRHSLKFAMQAAQAKAKIDYQGITTAQVSYHVAQSTLNIEVREKLPVMKSEIVYNHINKPSDTRDTVSLRWNW